MLEVRKKKQVRGPEVHGRTTIKCQKATKTNTKDEFTHDMAGDVPEAAYMRTMEEWSVSVSANDMGKKKGIPSYMVRQMLIRRSQLQPVMNATAAGGKKMAT